MTITADATTYAGAASATNANSYTTASQTPVAGDRVLVVVGSAHSSLVPNQPTITGNGQTWTAIGTAQTGIVRATMFSCLVASPSAGTCVIDFAGQTQQRCIWSFVGFRSGLGTITTGTVATNTGNPGNTASVTPTDPGGGGGVHAGIYKADTGAYTKDANYTLADEASAGAEASRLQTQYLINSVSDLTANWTWTTSVQHAEVGVVLVEPAAGPTTHHGAAVGTAASGITGVVGHHTQKAVAKGTAASAATVVGHLTQRATAKGTVAASGSAAGHHTQKAVAKGTVASAATVVGHLTQRATAKGSAALDGTATGRVTHHGTATGQTAASGTADGHHISGPTLAADAATYTSSGSGTDATSYTTASQTPVAGDRVLAVVGTGVSSGTANTPTITGNGQTWTLVASKNQGTQRVSMFECLVASPTAGTCVIDFAGQTQVRCAWSFVGFSSTLGTITLGTGATNSSAPNIAASVTVTDPGGGSGVFAGCWKSGVAAFTKDTNYTAADEQATAAEAGRLHTQYLINSVSDLTADWTWGATPTAWATVGVVLIEAGGVTHHGAAVGQAAASGAARLKASFRAQAGGPAAASGTAWARITLGARAAGATASSGQAAATVIRPIHHAAAKGATASSATGVWHRVCQYHAVATGAVAVAATAVGRVGVILVHHAAAVGANVSHGTSTGRVLQPFAQHPERITVGRSGSGILMGRGSAVTRVGRGGTVTITRSGTVAEVGDDGTVATTRSGTVRL